MLQDILTKVMKFNITDITTRFSHACANYSSTIAISKTYDEYIWIIAETGSGETITESIEKAYDKLLLKLTNLIKSITQFDVHCKYRMIDNLIYSSLSIEYFEKSDFTSTRKTSIQFNVQDSKELIESILISSRTIIKERLLEIKENIS